MRSFAAIWPGSEAFRTLPGVKVPVVVARLMDAVESEHGRRP